MKIAKRYILLLLVFVVSLSLCSCSSSTVVISQGLENYTGVESNYGLCPGEALNTLMAEFDYVNGDFYYYDKSNIGGSIEEYTIAYFTYTEHIYDQVKPRVQELFIIRGEEICSYNGYRFFEYGELLPGRPIWLRMVAFSDKTSTVVFIGFHGNEETKAANADLLENDWGGFLKKYYGEHFAFE